MRPGSAKVAGTKCAGAIGTRQLRRPAICTPIRRGGHHRGVPTCMPTRSQEQAANSLCRHSKTEKVLTIWNMEYGYGWWNMDMGDLLDRPSSSTNWSDSLVSRL